jgi:hypothetical protein
VGLLGGLLGGAIYGYGSQVVRNYNEGMCPWEALTTNIDAGQIALYAGAGTLLGLGIGGVVLGGQWLLGFLGFLSADGDPLNEIRTGTTVIKSSAEIGREGVDDVISLLNDPSAQREVTIYVNEAGKRANIFARLDILTNTAIHEVKNVADLDLSQDFMAQATKYKAIADAAGLELNYWLMNDAPNHVASWLQSQGINVIIP